MTYNHRDDDGDEWAIAIIAVLVGFAIGVVVTVGLWSWWHGYVT